MKQNLKANQVGKYYDVEILLNYFLIIIIYLKIIVNPYKINPI
jgi:hypothetical protein